METLEKLLSNFYLPAASRERLVLLLKRKLGLPLLLEGLPHSGREHLALKVASWWHGEETSSRLNPDTLVLQAEEGGTISISMVRSFSHLLELTPYSSRVKVGIILNAENLTLEAANALLKTLEEARGDVRLILTVVDARKLLPTFTSRCLRFALPPLSLEELKKVAQKEKWTITEEMLKLAAGRVGYLKKLSQDKSFLQGVLEDRERVTDLLRLDSTGERLFAVKSYFKGETDRFFSALENFLLSSYPGERWASAWRLLEQARHKVALNMNSNLVMSELLITLPVFS